MEHAFCACSAALFKLARLIKPLVVVAAVVVIMLQMQASIGGSQQHANNQRTPSSSYNPHSPIPNPKLNPDAK